MQNDSTYNISITSYYSIFYYPSTYSLDHVIGNSNIIIYIANYNIKMLDVKIITENRGYHIYECICLCVCIYDIYMYFIFIKDKYKKM